jgi:hypothetical protein
MNLEKFHCHDHNIEAREGNCSNTVAIDKLNIQMITKRDN